MKYTISQWDKAGYIRKSIISDANGKIERELNGNNLFSFDVGNISASFSIGDIIRLHDETKKCITKVIGIPSANNISLEDGEGLIFDDCIIVYNMPNGTVSESCTDSLARAKSYISSAYTDETTEANDDDINDMTILGAAVGDIYYYGDTLQFNVLTVIVDKIGIGDYDVIWEYYNGSSWVELYLDYDTINEYREYGEQYIAFETPSDWAQVVVDSQTYYWIRSRITRKVTIDQQALGTRAYIGWYGSDCKIQVTTTNISANDLLYLESNDVSEPIKVKSIHTSPLHYIIADVGEVHKYNEYITSPGASFIGKITTMREGITTLSSGITAGSSVVCTIGDTAGFIAGDYCRFCDANAENCLIDSVNVGASTITLSSVTYNHSAGEKMTNFSYTLSRMDFTPDVGSVVEYVDFKSYRIAEIQENIRTTNVKCEDISYDLNDKYFAYYGRFDVSFNPNKDGSLITDKVDVDTFVDYVLDRNVDESGDPLGYSSFIKGDLYSLKYSKGRVSVTNGSALITGVDTWWLNDDVHGDSIFVVEGDSTIYSTSYIVSNTSLAVNTTIVRESGDNLRYLIISKSVYSDGIYNTGTLSVDQNSREVTITDGGSFAGIAAGAKLGIFGDDNTYYTIQPFNAGAQMKLNKPVERSSGVTLSFWFDDDIRELSVSGATLRGALLEMCEVFSDDEWVTWLEVGEDRAINIIRRPLPFSADPTSSLVVKAGKNAIGIQREQQITDLGNLVIPQGASSGWENVFSGVSSAIADDDRNSTTVVKLVDGDAKYFRAFDAVEILRYAVTLTNSTCTENTFVISPGQKDYQDDGGVFTDYSSAAENESTRDDVVLLPVTPAVNDAFYFGANYEFSKIGIVLSTPGVGTWTIVWQYYNGSSWSTLTFATQQVTDFTETSNEYLHNIFSIPSDWATTTVNGSNLYWVRARVSAYTSITTQPLAAACYHGNLKSNDLSNGRIVITSGNGAGQMRTIARNTSDTITVTRKWDILPYASSAIASAKYSNPIHVRGFGYYEGTVSAGARLRRVECKNYNSLATGTATTGSGATACVDNAGRDMSALCAVGDYIYNIDDINSLTQLSAWGVITSFTTTSSTNDTINFSGGLSEGDSDDFQVGEEFVVVDNAESVRGKYRGGIISFLSGGANGNSYELWGNDDISFITDEQMYSPLPHSDDEFSVVAPAQLVEQFDDDGTYPDYNPGPWVQVSNSSRYFQIDAYNGGRLYIGSGDRAGDYYTISDTTPQTIVPSTGWGTQPADGDTCMIVKETDLPLTIAEHDYSPLGGDQVVLLLYETGTPLSVGKYAGYRTIVSDGSVSLTKQLVTVDNPDIFSPGDVIYLGSKQIISTLIFGINRGSQTIGQIARIASISGDEITLEEELDTIPQPGDCVELVGISDIASIRKNKRVIEKIYSANEITDPRWLYFYGKKYLDKISSKPIPTYKTDFLSLYDISPLEWEADKYELGDTITIIDHTLDININTIRINKESISFGSAPTVSVEGSNPAIVTRKMLSDDVVDKLTTRVDSMKSGFQKHQYSALKCKYFWGGICRKAATPNTFCNTEESNRDGKLTKEGSPIQYINCQSFTAYELV